MSLGRWLALLLVAFVVGLGVLFYVQNSLRTSDLSLDLAFAAWHLRDPLPVPALLYGAFGLGLLVGLGLMVGLWRGAARRAAELEDRLARAGVAPPQGDLWT